MAFGQFWNSKVDMGDYHQVLSEAGIPERRKENAAYLSYP